MAKEEREKPAAKPATKKSPEATVPEKTPAHPSLLKKVENKVAGAFKAVTDTLTDAEQLHEKLDPGISRESE